MNSTTWNNTTDKWYASLIWVKLNLVNMTSSLFRLKIDKTQSHSIHHQMPQVKSNNSEIETKKKNA